MTELFEEHELPCFNSCAIEQRLIRIKGLSENFLYANDDMMFGAPTAPSFFFHRNGKPYARLDHIGSKRYKAMMTRTLYGHTIGQVTQRIKADFGIDFTEYAPMHQIDAYKKSSIRQCLEQYKGWSELTLSHTFRHEDDMQRHMFVLYGLATKQYSPARTFQPRWKRVILHVRKKIRLAPKRKTIFFTLRQETERILTRCKKNKPNLVCFNDSERSTDEDRDRAKLYLPVLFPYPSSFELKPNRQTQK